MPVTAIGLVDSAKRRDNADFCSGLRAATADSIVLLLSAIIDLALECLQEIDDLILFGLVKLGCTVIAWAAFVIPEA